MSRVPEGQRLAIVDGKTIVALPSLWRIGRSLVNAFNLLNDSHLSAWKLTAFRYEAELSPGWELRRWSAKGSQETFPDGVLGYSALSADYEVEAIFNPEGDKVVIICSRCDPLDPINNASWVEKPPLVPVQR
ncbi:hypothetical protein A3A70_02325 [candidate division WWE3 bacterium RIFCSPLOWO2_01_FULL_42_11]|uniref:Uncharacterized protein n=1 Tax=candidate division WWE3 bacterium RIFCSPLOWO2_01_FULL_42_11 TaxID=1802627 RepID=A0A1F4VS26_UNCKA|nr:MAG: hypothetical protein A3A70_02325 [candidate division WWE3 bacterium RIFCSPLOWO2_01_FULL_42_11]